MENTLKPISIICSRLIIGETKSDWKISMIFIGTFSDKIKLATRVGNKKYHIVNKKLLKPHEIGETNNNGYPNIFDEVCNDNNCLYYKDWNKLETWKIC